MNNNFLNKLEVLLKQSGSKLIIANKIEFKNSFGAVSGYVNSRIFISCGKFGVALKLPPQVLAELFCEKDVSHLQYFPKGHIKRKYAVIPQRILDNSTRFKKLVDKSIHYVLALWEVGILFERR